MHISPLLVSNNYIFVLLIGPISSKVACVSYMICLTLLISKTSGKKCYTFSQAKLGREVTGLKKRTSFEGGSAGYQVTRAIECSFDVRRISGSRQMHLNFNDSQNLF